MGLTQDLEERELNGFEKYERALLNGRFLSPVFMTNEAVLMLGISDYRERSKREPVFTDCLLNT